jgi:hypothetical protein
MISSSPSPTMTPSPLGSSGINYALIVKGIIYSIIIMSLGVSTAAAQSTGKRISLACVTFIFTIFLLGLFFSFSKVVKGMLFTPQQLLLVLFNIILIVTFNYVSKDFMNKYAYYIFPFIFMIGIYLFYKGVYNATDIGRKFISKDTFQVNVFIIYICFVTYIILLNNELSKYINYSTGSVLTFFVLLITIGFLFLCFTVFNDAPLNIIKQQLNSISPGLFTSVGAFFVITFAILIIVWFSISITNAYNTSNVMSFIVNLILLMAMLGLMYKFLSVTKFYKKSPLLRLIVGVIFYIPCLVYAILEKIYSVLPKIPGVSGLFKKTGATGASAPTAAAAAAASDASHIGMLFFIIFLYLFYFIIYPYLSVKASKQGGLLLLNDPVSIHSEKVLASYQQLNQTDHFDYKFGLSFWLYLDSYKPHTNQGSNNYTSVLNYGDKPNILYNPVTNTLRVVMKIDVDKTDDATNYLSQKSKYDENGNVILYERSGILLQKWNNIIINYNGGTFDIFYNSELVKTHIEVVPYMNYDNLVLGTENGLYGSICNVNYFKNPMSIMQIYYLYNLVKTSTPPVVLGGKVTVFDAKNDYVKIPTTSFETSTIENALDSAADVSTTTVNNAVKDLTELNPYQQNYLSLKWYFMGNKDNQTI